MENILARELSAWIVTDEGTSGTGVLFCPPGDEHAYLLTCAHVIANAVSLSIHYLVPICPEQDNYQDAVIKVETADICIHPEYSATSNVFKNSSVDAAVLRFRRPDGMTRRVFLLGTPKRDICVCGYGFPLSFRSNDSLLFDQKWLSARISVAPLNTDQFIIELLHPSINQADRISELEGFSGTPLFLENDTTCVDLTIYGFLSSANRSNAEFNELRSVKSGVFHNLLALNNYPLPETPLPYMPNADEEECIEPSNLPVRMNKDTLLPSLRDFVVTSLRKRFEEAYLCVLDLQMAKAIEICREAVAQAPDTMETHNDLQKLYQLLAYCYVAVDDDIAWKEVVSHYDTSKSYLEKARFLWEKKQYREAKEQILLALNEKPNGIQERVYNVLIDIALSGTDDPQSMRELIDDECHMVLKPDSKELDVNMCQLYGYVYGTHFHQYGKAIRLVTRAYKLSGNALALETLSISYYYNALRMIEGDMIDPMQLDHESTYKARCCILELLNSADTLLEHGLLKRNGLAVFNIFFFCSDAYRISTLYPILISFYSQQAELAHELSFKYLIFQVESGHPDTIAMAYLTEDERTYFSIIAGCQQIIVDFDKLIYDDVLEHELQKKIHELDVFCTQVQGLQRNQVIIMIMNLYAYGHIAYNWAVGDKFNIWFARLEQANSYQMESMRLLIYEATHTIEEAEALYLNSAQSEAHPSSWSTLINFYVRHRMYDKGESVYQRILDHKLPVTDQEPEYLLRGYLNYIIDNKMNPTSAIRYFLRDKDTMLDKPIAALLNSELCNAVGNFNEPDEFIRLFRDFQREGLMSTDDCLHRSILYMIANARFSDAMRHIAQIQSDNLRPREKQLLHFVMRTMLTPAPIANDFDDNRLFIIITKQRDIPFSLNTNGLLERLSVDKTCTMDATSIALLAYENRLDDLCTFENVYIPHAALFRLLECCLLGQSASLRSALFFIECSDNIHMQSPCLENIQIARVDDRLWSEPMMAVALANELHCPTILADLTDYIRTDQFPHCVIRYGWYRATAAK